MDYAPYLTKSESINNVGLDEDAIIEYLCEKASIDSSPSNYSVKIVEIGSNRIRSTPKNVM